MRNILLEDNELDYSDELLNTYKQYDSNAQILIKTKNLHSSSSPNLIKRQLNICDENDDETKITPQRVIGGEDNS